METTLRAERYLEPIPEEARPHNASDKRRWCKGKVGVEHEAVWQFWFECYRYPTPTSTRHGWDWQRRKCLECGRVIGIRQVRSDQPSHATECSSASSLQQDTA